MKEGARFGGRISSRLTRSVAGAPPSTARFLIAAALVAIAAHAADDETGDRIDDKTPLSGLVIDGQPVVATRGGKDRGVRLRDVNHDGQAELIVGNESQSAVFAWSAEEKIWKRLPYALPPGTAIVDAHGRDAGLRFADLNGDGFDDVIFSGPSGYSIHLFVPVEKKNVDWKVGWSLEMRTGSRGDAGEIPLIAGRSEAVSFRDGAMIIRGKPERRIPFEDLLHAPAPAPKSPADSLAAIRVAPGFSVELVASEPLTMDPIAFEWGADGRLWILEMGDYPLGVDGNGKAGGVVRFLEDTDGDGRCDKSTVFLNDLPFPSGLMPWKKGVLVAAAPDIFYAEDTDGDGKADRRETLFTGFTLGNQQHRVNGFEAGLDGWIYAANGDSGGKITSVQTGATVDLGARDLRFRPGDGALELQSGRTQYGRHRDDWGNWFGGNNSTWAWHYFLPEKYLGRNPHLDVKETRRTLATRADANRVFPISATMRRFNWPGNTNALTSGCSVTPYRDQLFGDFFANALFICEPVHNLVHLELLERDGVTFTSHRATGQEAGEFLASADNWSRFCFARTGPDGALYIADMYRLVIEHPEWIPAEQQKRLDLRAGHDKGRIYRVLPTGTKSPPIPRLDRLDTAGLVAALDSPNGWQRDTAQRLILDAQDQAAIAPLEKLVIASERPKTRLQALCTLEGLGALRPEVALAGLRDPHPAVRGQALRASEPSLGKAVMLEDAVLSRADDPDIRVRFQCAFTLGEWNDSRAASTLLRIGAREAESAEMQLAVMSSAPRHLHHMIEGLLWAASEAPPAALLEQLITLAVGMNDATTLTRALERIAQPREEGIARWHFAAVAGLLEGVARKNVPLGRFARAAPAELRTAIDGLNEIFAAAHTVVDSATAPEDDRVAAIRLLGRGPQGGEDLPQLAALLQSGQTTNIQTAALAALRQSDRASVAQLLADEWSGLSPSLRFEALNLIFRKPAWIAGLLSAIEEGKVPAAQIDTAHQEKLLGHADATTRERAAKLFQATNADRTAVIKDYASAGELTGDAGKGATLFQQNCAICHRLRGVGMEVGPDLAMLADKPTGYFLDAIFDPNKAVESRYLGFTVTTKSGRKLAGIVATETPTSVIIRSPGGSEETMLRSDVQSLVGATTSLMPEGFEKVLRPQDVADLVAFIRAGPAAARPQ